MTEGDVYCTNSYSVRCVRHEKILSLSLSLSLQSEPAPESTTPDRRVALLRRFGCYSIIALLAGCDCACDRIPCPDFANDTEIEGANIYWRPDSFTSILVTDSEICVGFPGGDSPLPPDAEPKDWAAYFRLAASSASDTDRITVIRYLDAEADCAVRSRPNVDEDGNPVISPVADPVTATWSGSVSWAAGEYTLKCTWDDRAGTDINSDGVIECSMFDDEKVDHEVKIFFYEVKLSGPDSVVRGEEGEWEVESTGTPEEPLFQWSSTGTHFTTEVGDVTWGGTMVRSCIITAEGEFDCPIGGRISVTASKTVTVTPRTGWNLSLGAPVRRFPFDISPENASPPVHEDLLPLLEDPCPPVSIYGASWAYPYPNGDGQGDEMAQSLQIGGVTGGPNSGAVYVKSASAMKFEIDVNTNKHLYDPGSHYYQENLPDGYVSEFRASAEAHELWHHCNFDRAERELPDMAVAVEGIVAMSPIDVYSACKSAIEPILERIRVECPGNAEHVLGDTPDPPLSFYICDGLRFPWNFQVDVDARRTTCADQCE